MSKKRRILVIVGSDSDMPQCYNGLGILDTYMQSGEIEVIEVVTASIHRNMKFVMELVADHALNDKADTSLPAPVGRITLLV